jgi:hypothetical protein
MLIRFVKKVFIIFIDVSDHEALDFTSRAQSDKRILVDPAEKIENCQIIQV